MASSKDKVTCSPFCKFLMVTLSVIISLSPITIANRTPILLAKSNCLLIRLSSGKTIVFIFLALSCEASFTPYC